MRKSGSRGPRPYRQRQARTLFVRVPSAEWAAVSCGRKREFRAQSGKATALWNSETPTPVIAYRLDSFARYDAVLMVLEAVWREPLGSITPQSLKAEGFDSLAEFRRWWISREHRPFPMLAMTTAYRVRPWEPQDAEEMGAFLLSRLYGEFLPSLDAVGSR